jgi:hypothetical protein
MAEAGSKCDAAKKIKKIGQRFLEPGAYGRLESGMFTQAIDWLPRPSLRLAGQLIAKALVLFLEF